MTYVLTGCTCTQTGFNPSNPAEVLSKITVGNFSLWADSVVVAALTWYGAGAFAEVLRAKGGNQLPLVFQVCCPYILVYKSSTTTESKLPLPLHLENPSTWHGTQSAVI